MFFGMGFRTSSLLKPFYLFGIESVSIMDDLPLHLPVAFILTTVLTLFLFDRASRHSKKAMVLAVLLLLIHGVLAHGSFYRNVSAIPPRIFLTFGPVIVLFLVLFFSRWGKRWLERLDLKLLTLVHIVRIPVELILYGLFLNGAIPELMTFSGRNYDILAGITAPFVYYLGFVKSVLDKKTILLWNIVCLGLLLNIIVNAILSTPLPFQQFAFDRPNIAIFHFPFVWLPALIVPIVMLSHLVALVRLTAKEG